MRLACLAILAGATCAARSALADSITETIAFYGTVDTGGNTVYGPVFNASLGTLTGVSVTITGTLRPSVVTYTANVPTYAQLDGYINLLGDAWPPTILNYSTVILTQNGGYLTGPPEPFGFTASTTYGLYSYTSGPAYQTTGLADLDVFLNAPYPGAWGCCGAYQDSVYSGNFAITYDYDVPEPASLALLGFGAALLPLARATRKHRQHQPASA